MRPALRPLAPIAAGYVAGMAAYSNLPGPYFNADHLPPTRPLIAFLLPTAAAVIYVVFRRLLTRGAWGDDDVASQDTCYAIALQVTLFIVALHALILIQLTGASSWRTWAPRAVLVLFGMLLIGVGNLLPRTRPNLVIGIRTARTLADRRVWIQTHRVCGYVSVALGATVAVTGAVLPAYAMGPVVTTVAVAALATVLASYWKYARA